MKAVMFWSGGKDSMFALQELRRADEHEVVALLTTYDASARVLPLHGVALELIEQQARRLELPLLTAALPPACPNGFYEQAVGQLLTMAGEDLGAEALVFGDIFLEDIRAWRTALADRLGFSCIYPLWQRSTVSLAREIIASGIGALVSGIDRSVLGEEWLGRQFDEDFLRELPPGVDPCGENGEFHTFVYASPEWREAIPFNQHAFASSGRFPSLRLSALQ